MNVIGLQMLGKLVAKKQGERGVREVAKEIGISHGTLSRIRRGYAPDLETFKKICLWLEVDPAEILGMKPSQKKAVQSASVHFKKDQALNPKTAEALAQMILAAQRALMAAEERDK